MKVLTTYLMREIVYAFIDSQNLNLGIKNLGWRLDFKKFRKYLADKFRVNKAFLFLGYLKENEYIYQILRSYDYEIVFKPTIKYGNRSTKGNVDAELVLHSAKIQYKNYDKAVVVSGDGDFHCLLKDMDKENRLRSLLIPNRNSQSTLLKEFEKYKYFLDKEKLKIEKE